MYATSTPTAHAAHCSHHSQHWDLIQLACDRSDVRSIAIMTGGSIDARKIQRLQKSKNLRVILCGEGKKLEATAVSIRYPQVEVKRLFTPPHPLSLPLSTKPGNDCDHFPVSGCDFTLVIGIDVSGNPIFVILGNYRLGSPSKKTGSSTTICDPLDRATYLAIPEVAKTLLGLFSVYWVRGQEVITSTNVVPTAAHSRANRAHAEGTTIKQQIPKARHRCSDHLVHIAQAVLSNVSIALSVGMPQSHKALLTGAFGDPNIVMVDILLGSHVYTTDLFPLLATKERVRVVVFGAAPTPGGEEGRVYTFHPAWQVKYMRSHDRKKNLSIPGCAAMPNSFSSSSKQPGSCKTIPYTSNMFLLTGKTSDGRAVFSLEGSVSTPVDCSSPPIRRQHVRTAASSIVPVRGSSDQGVQGILSYCMYMKSSDSVGIVESHTRDFEDTFSVC
jgi:hypothetical protein